MTTSAVVYSFLFIHIGVILVITAYYAVGSLLAPALTERARTRFAARPWLPVLVGLGVSVPWVLAAIVLLNLPAAPAKFAGAVLGCGWVLCGLIGGAAIAQQVGRGGGPAPLPWVAAVRGGLLITLTWVLPLVGWLGMLPLSLATGVGCLILGIAPMRSNRATAVPATV
ncbi:MAG: hypothetical protein HKO59_14830 [Phycisphaerales bacterium]|nr:hypothetical protein [Phycisphaerae bacterium]NNF41982.1 hypothetical protein [Phycisphaerales bacterium]NNM27233.1 hypothetical protein [Phycisphaerales bacterium]